MLMTFDTLGGFFKHLTSCRLLREIISAFIILTILLSTTTFILESMPGFQHRPPLCQELLSAKEPITKEACEPVPRRFQTSNEF